MPERFSRHYCDFYELIRKGVDAAATAKPELLARSMQRVAVAAASGPAAATRQGRAGGPGGAITLHYAPTIHMPGGANKDEFGRQLREHMHEIELLLERLEESQHFNCLTQTHIVRQATA